MRQVRRQARRALASAAVVAMGLGLVACKQAPGTITTFAGNGTTTWSGDGGPAVQAGVPAPEAVAVDAAGHTYLSSDIAGGPNQIREIAPDGTISTIYSSTDSLTSLVATADGTLYFVAANSVVTGRAPDGTVSPITTLASPGFTMALLPDGNLVAAEAYLSLVVEVDVSTGTKTTIAGNGTNGTAGENGPALDAELDIPDSTAVAADGSIYIGEWSGTAGVRILRVDATTGILTRIAGSTATSPVVPGNGDGGPATSAQLGTVVGLVVSPDGSVLFSELADVRRVAPDGTISTVTGSATRSSTGDGGAATNATLSSPAGITIDAQGNLLITDHNANNVRRVAPPFN
jgi:sugar lactone lactonase YvrE